MNRNGESKEEPPNCEKNEDFLELHLGDNKHIRICSDFVQKLDDILLKTLNTKYFISFNSSLILNYRSIERLASEKFNTFLKGVKFKISSVKINSSLELTVPLKYDQDYHETISNKSVTIYSFSKFHVPNYPFQLPNDLNVSIYLKAPINYQIELRAPKGFFFFKIDYRSIYLNNLDTICRLNSNRTTFRPQIKIKDQFAHLNLIPAKADIYFLCLQEDELNYYSAYQLKQTKLIKSNLHVIYIYLNYGWHPSPFYFRIIKGIF